MNKKRFTAILAVIMSLSLAACGNSSGTEQEKGDAAVEQTEGEAGADSEITIGFSVKTLQEERWQRDVEVCQQVADEYGVELAVQVADNDANKQISQIENLVTQGVDVLLVAPVDSGALSAVLNDAHEQGVYIIGFDIEAENAWCDAYVGYECVDLGETMVKSLAEQKVPGNYVLLYGDKSSGAPVQDMIEGWHNQLQPLVDDGTIEIIMEQYCQEWKAEEAVRYVENALSMEGDDLAAVVCMNDSIASGAISALEAAGLDGKVYVTGGDGELTAVQRIVNGTQYSTIYKDTSAIAKKSIEVAIALVNGEELEGDATINLGVNDAPWFITEANIVTKDTVDSVMVDSGVFTKEEVYSEAE